MMKQPDFEQIFKAPKLIAKKAEQQSYKKLLIFGLIIGVSFGLVSGIFHMWSASNARDAAQEALETKNKTDILSAQIRPISETDLNNFVTYLNRNQDMYDKKIKLVINAYTQSAMEDAPNSARSDDIATKLATVFSDYQSSNQTDIANFKTVYQEVKMNRLVDTDVARNFLTEYSMFQNHATIPNPDMEKFINSYLYPQEVGNIRYFTKNKIYQQVQDLKVEN